ncbi:MAG: surface-adhesin E family protein [Gemmatimonadaceae bacterium]
MIHLRPSAPLLALCVTLAASPLGAQVTPRWEEIGRTSTGNTVYLDPRSISRDSTGIITATVRVVYTTPVDTPQGPITGSRAIAMFDCAGRKVAVKENIIWHDERRGTVYRRSAPTRPGFGPALTSTFAHVALEHLCAPLQRPG